MALAASGHYREAEAVFGEARAIGERHRATSLLARAVSMSTGLHLDLGDLDTAEDLATEARELSASSGWDPGYVSAGIDLIVCRLRRGDVATAEKLLEESATRAAAIRARKPGGSGFHDWLWNIRLAWARAEIARAKRDHELAIREANVTLKLATGGRPKYEIAALITRAEASTKREAALADLDRALIRARTTGNPALSLRAAKLRQALEATDDLAIEISSLESKLTL